MIIIKMIGEATEEKDTRKFFLCQEDGEHEIDREAAAMFVLVGIQDKTLKTYTKNNAQYWAILSKKYIIEEKSQCVT